MNLRNLALVLPIAAFLVPQASWGCSIPVFRYALERWELGPHDVIVFRKGSPSAGEKEVLARLQTPAPKANLSVTVVDPAGKMDPAHRELWERHGKDQPLPWLAVRNANPELKSAAPLWSGALGPDNVARLLESPARRQLVRRLSQGDSIVFLLLECDDAMANAAAAQLLDRELASLKSKVQLPEQTAEGPQLRYPLPLRVAFPVVKVSPQDPAERIFVQMLLGSEEGLSTAKGPIVFPIFGRGRLLCSLQGEDLSDKQLTSVVRYLCGACSCQVKELNPGVDLLISANWTGLLESSQTSAALAEQVTMPILRVLDYVEANGALVTKAWREGDAAMTELLGKMEPESSVASSAPTTCDVPATLARPSGPARRSCCHGEESTRFWLWSGAGGALLLVVLTGMWVGRAH